VYIPGGTFLMGSPKTEKERLEQEGPQHEVTITAFYMGKYPVTQEQWEAVMKTNPSYFKGANRPVEQVSWDEAVEFCRRLNEKLRRNGANPPLPLPGGEYRLPSEAEWEYACRAGTTTPFHFGETITPELANYDGNYPYASGPKGIDRKETTEVGRFPPNAFGLYDMHGNVWEWCQDWYDQNYYAQSPKENPSGPASGSYRVSRGGGWNDDAWGCRSACRGGWLPDRRVYGVGFRLLRTPS
jgi:formylglycine-generating enzyme required for sulfatase activity